MADISQPLTSTWRAPQAQAARTIGNAGLPLFVAVFLVGLLIPLIINVGGMRLSIYRIVLLLMFVPALVRLLSGAAGPLRTPDFAVLVICIWSNLSLLVVQGPLIETIGILTVETMGAYLIGRAYIRTPEAFLATCRMLLALALLVFPFALAETATGTRFILNIFDMVGRTYPDVPKDPRMGLNRVQGPFAHQIHFGVFFGVLIGITFYVVGYGKSFLGQSWRTLVVAITGALALSSGPLSALVAQLYMGFWDWGLRRIKIRWYILAGLTVFAYVTIDLLSNRNPFQIFTKKKKKKKKKKAPRVDPPACND